MNAGISINEWVCHRPASLAAVNRQTDPAEEVMKQIGKAKRADVIGEAIDPSQ